MADPVVTGHDEAVEDDGENFATPTIVVDQDSLIIVDWPGGKKSKNVHMATELFEEWVAMMNALRRFADLTIEVQRIRTAGGQPSDDMLSAISRLHLQLRLG
jgi:hypothetical protein